MKIPTKNINKIFQNKIVLYILLGISFLNLLGYLAKNNLTAIIMFIVIAYICTFFTKNMSYILLIPLILTNLLITLLKSNQITFKEGLDNKSKSKKQTDKTLKEGIDIPKPSKEKTSTKNNDDLSDAKKLNDNDDDDDEIENYTNAKLKKQETIENAYNSLDKIIGGDQLKKMNKDSQQIAGNQKELLSLIEKMGPLMDTANTMLTKFENSPLAKFLPKA
tara:strand:+ start:311 stop:970 length:660 start_codon:yes stop_codon:yes gene_type:complete